MNTLHTAINDSQKILKKVIELSGASNKEVADIIGCSERTVRRWLNPNDSSAGSIKLSDFLAICGHFGIDFDFEKEVH